ncbi:hypothetical protein C8J57DRAFT_1303424, partial [Mycena rebaudengoi]
MECWFELYSGYWIVRVCVSILLFFVQLSTALPIFGQIHTYLFLVCTACHVQIIAFCPVC